MNTRILPFIGFVAICVLLLALAPASAIQLTQTEQPPSQTTALETRNCTSEHRAQLDSIDPVLERNSEGQWFVSDGSALSARSTLGPSASGGPDEFGYTWNDTVSFSWINATSGVATTLGGSTTVVGPISLPFSFRFYENTYNQIYISKYGYAGFTNTDLTRAQGQIPLPDTPNNIIAPYWVPSLINESGYTGKVYYMSGGTAPNRYFVIEWYQIRGDYLPDNNIYTFEVVLYENGDILIQHGTMTYGSGWVCGHVGIEDSEGLDGLAYGTFCQQYVSNRAIRFYRPASSARVQVRPAYHGQFAGAGATVAYPQRIRNTGDLGTDVYDLSYSSPWPVTLYAANGTTPLTDSDGDGTVDTGPVTQGASVDVTVKVEVPSSGVLGDDNTSAVTIRSSLNAAKQKVARYQTAIPAPFAQVFRDNADNAQSLYLVQSNAQNVRKVTPDYYYGYYPVVAEMPNRNFAYAWAKYRWTGSIGAYEIEYTLLDPTGATVRSVSRLTNHSSASFNTYDYLPAVAVAPNGRIGFVWYRYLYDSVNGTWNYNIYFAVVDASGNIVVAPTNLTNNSSWGYG
jgi:hypothetical protein